MLAAAGQARAQSAEAEALFADGTRLMAAGKLDQACDAFDASNRIEPRAGTLIRLGECRETNHQLASAWSAYKDALTRVKDPRKKAFATRKVAALEPRLSYLTIVVDDGSRLDGLVVTRNGQPLDPALWNRAVPVNGGDYVLTARVPGRKDWEATATVPVESGQITIEVPRLELRVRPVPPASTATTATLTSSSSRAGADSIRPRSGYPAPASAPDVRTGRADSIGRSTSASSSSAAHSPPRRAASESMQAEAQAEPATVWTGRRKVGAGFLAGSAAALGVGVVLGAIAAGKPDEAHKLCPSHDTPCGDADRANQLIRDGKSLAFDANLALGVAAGLAIGAGVLWFTGAPETRGLAIAPRIAPGAAGLAVLGRF